MVIPEKVVIDGEEFIKNYSDSGYMIKKVGTDEMYSEAIDPIGSGRTYVETDEPIVKPEILEEIEDPQMEI